MRRIILFWLIVLLMCLLSCISFAQQDKDCINDYGGQVCGFEEICVGDEIKVGDVMCCVGEFGCMSYADEEDCVEDYGGQECDFFEVCVGDEINVSDVMCCVGDFGCTLVSEYENFVNFSDFEEEDLDCGEEQGVVCDDGQVCSGEWDFDIDENTYCCVGGECVDEYEDVLTVEDLGDEDVSNYEYGMFGFLIILALLVVIIVLFVFYFVHKRDGTVVDKISNEALYLKRSGYSKDQMRKYLVETRLYKKGDVSRALKKIK